MSSTSTTSGRSATTSLKNSAQAVVEAIAGDERVHVAGDVEAQREPENVTGAESVERHFWCVALQ